jgi:hypothetical protein
MASSISTVAVDFVANVAKYISGLDTMASKTKSWSDKTKKDTQGATDAFDGTSKAINNLAKNVLALVAIEKIGAAFANAAKQVSLIADEAEKVGAQAGQFDKLRLAAERNGSNIGDVKIAYKELQKSINEALGGTKETIKAFDSLGLSYSYLANLSPDERFKEIAQALSEVSDENKRAELGVKLLGKAYTELSPLIAKGAAGIQAGGQGSLSDAQIKSIDKVTKSFEELGRVLDGSIKKALADFAPVIIKVAESLAYVARNLTSFVTLIALAFSPAPLLKFSAVIQTLAFAINFQVVKALGALIISLQTTNAGMATFIGLRAVSFMSALTTPVLALAAGFRTLATAIAATFKALTIFLIAFEAVTRVVGKGAEILGFDQYAEALKQIREGVEDAVLGFAGFETADDKVKEFIKSTAEKLDAAQKRLKNSANEAGQALDSEAQYIKDLEDAFKNAEQAALDFAKATTEKFESPYEKAKSEMDKLTLAVDRGRITVGTYKKAVAELAAGLSQVDLDKLRRTFVGGGPFGALGTDRGLGAGSANSFAQRSQRGEMFGAGTFVSSTQPMGFGAGVGLPKGFSLPNISVNEDERKRIENLGKTLTEEGRSATEVYNQRVKDIEAASVAVDQYGKSVLSAEGKTKALTDATTQFAQSQADAFAATTPYWEEAVGLTQNFADGLASAITEGKNFGDALKGVFQDILKQILMLTIRTAILQSIMAAVGLASAPAALAFGQMTGIVGKAAGGPVTGGMPYKVGEAGPEMFVPSQNGYIVPNNMNNNSQPTVIQNITIQTGVAQTIRAELAAAMPRFKSEAMAGVLDAKNRGGSYSRGLATA